MSSPEEQAQNALRARLGMGARYDAATAPHEALLLARRGTAYFARKLNELTDRELDGPCLVEGWSRRHLIAHVCYQARGLARLIAWARTGQEQPMYPSAQARDEEIRLGATLPARALRNLFHHSEVHLNVEWRDLGEGAWDATLRLLDGQPVTARDTPMIRAKIVWRCAVDLGNGGRERDIPPAARQ